MNRVLSVNIARPQQDPGGAARQSGINKQPAARLDVVAPGPNYGDGSGVVGDTIGDTAHHGGAQKAVYAFSRERLDWWGNQLSYPLDNGMFGENLTTEGIDWTAVLINQRFRIGEVRAALAVPDLRCVDR